LGTLRRIWQALEQVQAFCEVNNGLCIRKALCGSLSCPLPVENRLLYSTSLSVVMGKEFWLRLDIFWKVSLQHVGNLLVILTPLAPEQ
jgi:hypothetical protein